MGKKFDLENLTAGVEEGIAILTKEDSTLENSGIYLFTDDVNAKTCTAAIRFILECNLNLNRTYDKIQLIISSYGGEVDSAMALCDVIEGSQIPVYTTGLGVIASAGLIIFMTGKQGERVITPNTSILSHQWSWWSQGKEHELLATVREFNLINDRILAHYKRHTGMTKAQINKYLLPPSDVWLSPEDAVKFGIADKIAKPSNKFKDMYTR